MAVIINQFVDHNYLGTLKAAADVKNGQFVLADFSAGTAAVPATDGDADGYGLFLVNNQNTHIEEELVADADFTVKSGSYLRLKALKVGEVITTDQFNGTFASFNVDDIVAVGDGGKVEAIGARTPVLRFQVVEKTKLYGNDALKLVVIAN